MFGRRVVRLMLVLVAVIMVLHVIQGALNHGSSHRAAVGVDCASPKGPTVTFGTAVSESLVDQCTRVKDAGMQWKRGMYHTLGHPNAQDGLATVCATPPCDAGASPQLLFHLNGRYDQFDAFMFITSGSTVTDPLHVTVAIDGGDETSHELVPGYYTHLHRTVASAQDVTVTVTLPPGNQERVGIIKPFGIRSSS